jgi:hypothetical protein
MISIQSRLCGYLSTRWAIFKHAEFTECSETGDITEQAYRIDDLADRSLRDCFTELYTVS